MFLFLLSQNKLNVLGAVLLTSVVAIIMRVRQHTRLSPTFQMLLSQ
jgi:hypothetical protein